MAIKKKIVEKATGEKYASKSAMAKHEKKESKSMQKKEMLKKSPMKQINTASATFKVKPGKRVESISETISPKAPRAARVIDKIGDRKKVGRAKVSITESPAIMKKC